MAPLDDWGKYPNGHNPRISSGTAPETFYNSLFALILTTLRFKEMSRGLSKATIPFSQRNLSKVNSGKKGFQTVDLSPGFVTSEGGNLSIDFLSMGFDLKKLLPEGESKLSRKRTIAYGAIEISTKIHLDGTIISKTVHCELSKLGLCSIG